MSEEQKQPETSPETPQPVAEQKAAPVEPASPAQSTPAPEAAPKPELPKKRVLVYDGHELPDPDPQMPADKVREFYAAFYPELGTAEVLPAVARPGKQSGDPGEEVIEFKRKVGTKGSDELMKDRFERVREQMWGAPGFAHRNSTIIAPGSSFFPQATWIIETIKTNDQTCIFLQVIDKDGGQRFFLPQKVAEALYNQRDSIMKLRRSVRAKHGAETRQAKGIVPFKKKGTN